MKILIIVALIAIVASLGSALYSMTSGSSKRSDGMVRALTIRVALSCALFVAIMLAWYFGLIEPHGIR